jgi:hypothetical protein
VLSPELNALKPHSRWLYVIICTKFNREKEKLKDEFPFTYDDLEAISHFDRRRLSASITELEENDFLDVVHGGRDNASKYRPVLKWLI